MSQVAKMIDDRLREKIEETVDGAHFGFRKGKGTRNTFFVLRTIVETAIVKQKDLYIISSSTL